MSELNSGDCPTAETLAAFIDGTGTDVERKIVQGHLETCENCMTVIRETARFEREQLDARVAPPETTVVPMRRTPPWWMAVAAGVAIAVVGGIAIWQIRPRDPLRQLYAAAGRVETRSVEGRLHGMEWRPLTPVERSGSARQENPAALKLRGAAGELLERSGDSEAAAEMHAAGIARLLTGDESQAVQRIEAATGKQRDNAWYWSDLAAARLSQGRSDRDPHAFALSLAAADRALRIDPQSPEALFNRAIALDSLGLHDEAVAAYRKYLEIDTASPWAAEVRERLSRLEKRSDRETWKDVMPSLSTADDAETKVLVERFPQEARKWGEGVFLGEWAEAEIAGRPEDAGAKLSIARSLGQALSEINAEHLLREAVAVIDRASVEKRRKLAAAHLVYQRGRMSYDKRNVTGALEPLSAAAEQFRTLGSPMAASARYYHANALHDSNRSAEALTAIRDLQATVPERYRGLRAHLKWQEGAVLGSLGQLVEAVAAYQSSAEIFHSLGETSNAAMMDQATGFGYSSTGRRLDAWKSYLRAWPAMRKDEGARFGSLVAMSRSEIAEEHWDVARSLADLGLALASRAPNARRETHLWLQRAIANAHTDHKEAFHDLRRATESAGRIQDKALEQSAMFDIRFLEATLAREGRPDRAVELLSANIEWARERKSLIRLPEQYLERSLARLAASETSEAAADLREALSIAEVRGASLVDMQARTSFMSSLDAAVDKNVDALLRKGRVDEAFALAEQSKHRIFLSGRAAEPQVRKVMTLSDDAVVAHYVSLPDSTVIFVMDRAGLVAYRQSISRVELERLVGRFLNAIDGGRSGESARDASHLFDVLVRPFSKRLVPNGKLVVIPDGAIARVPFAALRDETSNLLLIEQVQIQSAPSAGWYLTARKVNPPHRGLRAIVVGNPDFDRELLSDLPSLPAAMTEASDVAQIYGTNPITGSAATASRILGSLPTGDVFHFAGHAVVNEAEPRNSFLACARGNESSGLLYLRDLEQMSLEGLELAVLAGCRTAGAMSSSRHPLSVALAFLKAGALNTVGLLWNLEDQASREISVRLHQKVAGGMPASEALRETQLELIRGSDRHLRLEKNWAAYQIWSSAQIADDGTVSSNPVIIANR